GVALRAASRCALCEVIEGAGSPRALLRVDPGLLDDERLPETRGDPLDLVVGVGLRVADGHGVRQTLRVLLEVERQRDAGRHVVGDDSDAVAAEKNGAVLSEI